MADATITASTFHSLDPRTGSKVGAPLSESTADEIDRAVANAAAADPEWASSDAATRGALLNGLADALIAQRDRLVAIADQETALGIGRLSGELDRTAFQLRGFAKEALANVPFAVIDDPAVAGVPPVGRPRMTRVLVPIGPVAVFSASNFPFAFSVLGGDTASALAAGCPVVVKAHPGHPRLSRVVYEVASTVVADQKLPAGVLQLVQGPSIAVGVHLVRHPDISAVAFTGSFRGGAALQAECNARPRPIPFYGELGSINPVVALPGALGQSGDELAKALAASISQGSGQFCTSPGVLIVTDDKTTEVFLDKVGAALDAQTTHPMLTPGMRRSFEEGVARLGSHRSARRLVGSASKELAPRPHLIEVGVDDFLSDHTLREEVFGPAAIVVRVKDVAEVPRALRAVGGSLTVTIWGADRGDEQTLEIVTAATQIAGRVLFAGVPTGVAVTHAQHHGGPWPASTQPQTTSVGYAAIHRFLRPVALQDAPDWLLNKKGVT